MTQCTFNVDQGRQALIRRAVLASVHNKYQKSQNKLVTQSWSFVTTRISGDSNECNPQISHRFTRLKQKAPNEGETGALEPYPGSNLSWASYQGHVERIIPTMELKRNLRPLRTCVPVSYSFRFRFWQQCAIKAAENTPVLQVSCITEDRRWRKKMEEPLIISHTSVRSQPATLVELTL